MKQIVKFLNHPVSNANAKKGYFWRSSFVPAQNVQIDACEDIDECQNTTVCPSTTTCSNLPGDYTCKCKDGHRLEKGRSAKTDGCRAICDPNPCVHGTCSGSGRDGFSCSCEEFYTGLLCNQENKALAGAMKSRFLTAAIVGGILGVILVITIIICIILIRKVQKSKSIDEIEEYMRQFLESPTGLASEMNELGRRQQENNDIELRESGRNPNHDTENQNCNAQHPINRMTNSRSQLRRFSDEVAHREYDITERCESIDYRKEYTSDEKTFPKAHYSRHSVERAHRTR